MKSLSERIRKHRLVLKLSQKDLAIKLGLTQGSVAQMETGIRSPSVGILPKLAKIFVVSVDYLLTGQDAEMLDIGVLNAADRVLVRRFREFLIKEAKNAE